MFSELECVELSRFSVFFCFFFENDKTDLCQFFFMVLEKSLVLYNLHFILNFSNSVNTFKVNIVTLKSSNKS